MRIERGFRTRGLLLAVAAASVISFQGVLWGQTLGQALNATNLTWTTSGTGFSSGWSVENSTTHDGVSAAMSDFPQSASSTSILQTTVTGPGTLSFWWLSPSLYNTLTFNVAGTNIWFINYFSVWSQQTFYLGSGSQTLKWVYSRTSSPGDTGHGYLDEVSYTPGATAPLITAQPLSQSQVAGLNTTFTVSTGGTPPLSYQWQFNGTDIPGTTTTSYTVTNVQQTNLGSYRVVVTNSVGTNVSSNAVLEFGEVTAWGYSGLGATSVPPGATNVLAVAVGSYWGSALKTDGSWLAWGNNTSGQTNVPGNLTNVLGIDLGNEYGLALRGDKTVAAWGANDYGQTNVPAGLTNVAAIAAGGLHSLALRSDGTVVAWGANYLGQTNVPASVTNAVAVAASGDCSVALKADGTVVRWGSGPSTPADLTNVVAVGTGYSHGLGLLANGTIRLWGNNGLGQLNAPAGLSNVVAVSAGGNHSLVLLADGTVVTWGSDGAGLSTVPSGLTNVVAIVAGASQNLALVGTGPPVVRASVRVVSFSGSGFSLSVPSQSGRVYQLQYKNSVGDANWTSLPLVAGSGRAIVLTDTTATNSQHRIYRVLRW